MPDAELRDAYVSVEVELPNGEKIAGRPIHFRSGMILQGLMDDYVLQGTQKSFDAMFDAFTQTTGITEAAIDAKCHPISLPEILDLVRRFIYLLRPGRTAVQAKDGTPAATPAPALVLERASPSA
jgi:hypothetical protein